MRNDRTMKRTIKSALIAGFAAILLTASCVSTDSSRRDDDKLTVNIDDMMGLFSLEAESLREAILETGFYDAARSLKFEGFKLVYNGGTPKSPRTYLDFKVIKLRRSPANLYECSISATYYDADGDEINLGMFHGLRSGISVFDRTDIAEHFADAAEDAFVGALKKLME